MRRYLRIEDELNPEELDSLDAGTPDSSGPTLVPQGELVSQSQHREKNGLAIVPQAPKPMRLT
jgi:hypothetical protein